jgi:glycosyltransferase involved in cell wall biosynthesis
LLSWPWPDPANPYVLRLTEALAARGVVVHHARRLATHALRTHRAPWLHVHWPEWMIGSPSRIAYRARGQWAMALLDACRARGVSLAWTAHNLFMHDDPHPDLGEASRRALLQRCSVVFGHFAGAEAPLRALGFRGRFAVTPHAHFDRDYPLAFASDAAREAYRHTLGVRKGERLLVSAGAIEGYKNLPAIARALREARIEGLRWVVAGRVGDRAAYETLRREVAGVPWISLREGFLAPREMARIVAAGDAMLLGYRAFFTSGAAVLALTQGTPVMGAPEHHLATWQGERFFIPLRRVDVPALRVAIAQLISLDASVRGEARSRALGDTWEGAAAVIDHTLFGA